MIIPLTMDNLESCSELAAKVFGPDYISLRPDFFAWQFERASQLFDEGRDPGTWVYEEDGEVTALWLSNKAPMWLEGREFVGTWGHDWYADPDRMGGGLPLSVEQIKRAGVFASCGLGVLTAGIHHRLFPSIWFETRRLYGVIDPETTMRAMTTSSADALPMLKLHAKLAAPRSNDARSVESFDETYDACWRAVRETVSFATDRTAPYMNWRYIENPFIDYVCLRYGTEAGPAYFVYREETVDDMKYSVARITEAVGSRPALVEGFRALWRDLKAAGIAFCDYYGTHDETIAGLLEGGMRPVVTLEEFDLPRLFSPFAIDFRKTISVAVNIAPPFEAGDWLWHTGKWYVTKGDGNQDRINP